MVARTPAKVVKKAGATVRSPGSTTKQAAASDDGQIEGVSALAKRVGRVKKSGDLGSFMKRVGERNCLVRILDRLEENRELAPQVWQALENGMIKVPSSSGGGTAHFAKKVTRVSGLPSQWIAAWLLQNSGGKLNKSQIDTIDGNDPENLHHVFCAATKVSLSTPLPGEMQHKLVCSRAFTKRMDRCGSRLQTLSGNIRPDGSIDWAKWGPYKLGFEGNKIRSIVHIEGDRVDPLPEHVVLNKSFSLNLPWSEFETTLSLGSSSHTLCRLFADGKGPNKEKPGKHGALLDRVAMAAKKEVEDEEEQANRGKCNDEDDFLTKHDQKVTAQRKEILDQARKKLAASAAARRMVDLNAM